MDESSGLYPLRVEGAVFNLVERLLPGVITTTTGARYFGLHTLAWSDAQDRGLEAGEAEEFVRRCEVVMAAAFRGHETTGHLRRVPAAHGEDRLPRFMSGGRLDLAAAAALDGFSKEGFAGTYRRAEQAIGLLTAGQPPRRGPRADLGPLRAGLGDVLDLAREDVLKESTFSEIEHICPCQAAEAADGEWLQRVMFEEADPDFEGDRSRQVAALLLLDAVAMTSDGDVDRSFRLTAGFGDPIEDDSGDAPGCKPSYITGFRSARAA